MSNPTKLVEEMKRLRDEIRIQVHLGEMEAKQWWNQVEPQLIALETNLEKGADKATGTATIVLDEFVNAFHRIAERITPKE